MRRYIGATSLKISQLDKADGGGRGGHFTGSAPDWLVKTEAVKHHININFNETSKKIKCRGVACGVEKIIRVKFDANKNIYTSLTFTFIPV